MAVYTMQQYNDLLANIASGASSVSYDGKSVSNRSISDMLLLLGIMARDLGITPPRSSTILAAHDRGFIDSDDSNNTLSDPG